MPRQAYFSMDLSENWEVWIEMQRMVGEVGLSQPVSSSKNRNRVVYILGLWELIERMYMKLSGTYM